MIFFSHLLQLILFLNQQVIFDFNSDTNIRSWVSVDDVVMGGRSNGNMRLTEEGHGLFSGRVSLENNGGFSSVRYRSDKLRVTPDNNIKLRIKGDGNKYQFRVKDNLRNYYSYITYFDTSGDWEDIEINLKDMYPTFRGRSLNMPNFDADSIAEITFLIGNKKAQEFELIIDKIVLD